MKLLVIACTALVSLIPFVSANGATPEFRTQTVRFADLDLSRSEGLAVLFRRVHNAAEAVCVDSDTRTLLKEHNDCVHRALVNAVQSINQEAFRAYAAAHGVPAVSEQLALR